MVGRKGSLQRYRARRDFGRTAEPAGGGRRPGSRLRWVIRHHAATTDHYDVRLEVDGVLASWAVPKGPSTDPRITRLAIRTEDHPLEYADFEGVIPPGAYGAGTVLVWDRGHYRNITGAEDGDVVPMARALRRGHVAVWLLGTKLRGGYAITRIATGPPERWLLVKMTDSEADARRNPVSTEPRSVISGRTIAEIRRQGARGPG